MDTSARARALYANPKTSRNLAALPYEELGRVDNGVWVLCPDQTVLALANFDTPVFLYFDRRSYDDAVADLSPPQVQEVIRRRRDRFSPDAKAYLMSWLFDLECVTLEAALQTRGPGTAQIEKPLALLQFMAGLQRYKTVPAKAMAVTILEGESLLLAAIRSALENPILDDTAEKSILAAHFNRRSVWAASLRQVVATLGLPEFADAMPFADPARGVFVHPADQKFEQDLSKTGEPAVRWREGLVYVQAQRRLGSLREQGFSVDVLYANAGDYYDSVESLTQPQLHRDFDLRLKRSAAGVRRDQLGHIDRLHLHQILMKLELRARADATQACASAGMDALLQEEVGALGTALARNRSFSQSQGLGQVEPRVLIGTAQDIVKADIALFGAIASRYWSSIAPNLTDIEKLNNEGRISRP